MKVFDANTVLPEPLIIKIGKKEIKIDQISMRTALRVNEASSKKGMTDVEAINIMLDIVSDILVGADSEITREYLLDNMDTRQLAPIYTAVLQQMSSLAEPEKKPEPETVPPAET
jgi:transglutaminase/protease-like cytokinesis protein 3